MKKSILNFGILVIAICVILAACKKDEAVKKNSFKYNQKEAEISTVLGMQYGESPVSGIFGIELEFYEKSLTIHYADNYPDSISGSGDVLIVTFLTSSENTIPTGVYNFMSTNEPLKNFSIMGDGESFVVVNLDTSKENDLTTLEISGGKVTVSKSADEYEFTFDLKTTVNSNITGYYKGKPAIYKLKKKKTFQNETWFPKPCFFK